MAQGWCDGPPARKPDRRSVARPREVLLWLLFPAAPLMLLNRFLGEANLLIAIYYYVKRQSLFVDC